MRISITIFLLLFINIYEAFPQSIIINDIKELNGIWIAKDYFTSFENTGSSIKSIKSFDSNYPVGLRINSNEIKNNELTVGFGVLHDHLIHPEVSEYIIVGKDTIYEQGSFTVKINKEFANKHLLTSNIYFFNDESISFLAYSFNPDTTLKLLRPGTNKLSKEEITYIKISSVIEKDYPFPNPLYYYTRIRNLCGNYILKDQYGKVLSSNFKIHQDGSSTGYSLFDQKIFYFSTDIYCGPEEKYDKLLICKWDRNLECDCELYIYSNLKENIIQLYSTKLNQEYSNTDKDKLVYSLIKKH